jgi:hypothetical protein
VSTTRRRLDAASLAALACLVAAISGAWPASAAGPGAPARGPARDDSSAPAPPGGSLQLHITQPSSGATVRGTVWVVLWLGGASDGTNVYTLSVDGTVVATRSTTSMGPVSIQWTTTGTRNGTHELQAIARDTDGHTGAASVTVTVAN